MMKISLEYPPLYWKIKNAFPLCEKAQAVFTFKDTIYNPFDRKITIDVEEHEKVHMKQQGEKPDEWWDKYIMDKSFRFQEEKEAYKTQYALVRFVKDGRMREWILETLAKSLSSDLYGSMCTYGEARKILTAK